ncbi:MAG: CDP-alcohol phosphatidyltransferase family protein [candidate division WOR-3 bacterium]
MIGSRIGHSLDPFLLRVYHLLFSDRPVNPNLITALSLLFGLLCASLVVLERHVLAGAALIASGFFDVLDGAIARQTGRVTPFGGFLDSVLDRYTDLAVTLGIFVYFLAHGDALWSTLTFVAAIGTALVPYIRATAEAAGIECKSGLLERSERTLLLIIGLWFGVLTGVILLLAVFTHVTAVQRILIVKRSADR